MLYLPLRLPPVLLALLLGWALCSQEPRAGPHRFAMLHVSHFPNASLVQFWGNATLGDTVTHEMEKGGSPPTIRQLEFPEPPEVWAETLKGLKAYLEDFKNVVVLINHERGLSFPLTLTSSLGCELPGKGSAAHTFYEVSLNASVSFHFWPSPALWTSEWRGDLAAFTLKQLNRYNRTRYELQHFLQVTCVNYLKRKVPSFAPEQLISRPPPSASEQLIPSLHPSDRQVARSVRPLVMGIIVGIFTISGVAVGIFLCTGGGRRS
ncbi:endothelial protein C receptor isoform X2 [Tachyglossus aculeatus]|uniref:endothelial protein C receptor isoform X2 n=1 Tax=Tachyglossus aculeatus TaxID=9261 RepID=UPI0018F5E35F|nr:endothelial protein C receptor isoform X2 [Tachyglossus aculeatus]